MDKDRLIEIETKLAYQEQTIKDLNDVVYEQQKEIERLAAICNSLVTQGKELLQTTPENEKPPHY